MATPGRKMPIHLQSSQNRLLVKNGTVVNCDAMEQVDVYVEDAVIKQMGKHLIIPGGTRVIDAAGKYVIPGGIDANVHLQTPVKGLDCETATVDNFYQGTKAALAGGTTMVLDMVMPDSEEKDTLEESYHKWRGWAEEKACCDYALKVALPRKLDDVKLKEAELLSSSEFGVNTFHASMSGDRQMNDGDLVEAMKACKRLGAVLQVHAENGDVIKRAEGKMLERGVTGPEGYGASHSEGAEEEATLRAATLSSQVNCPLYVTHVSCKSALEVIMRKKSDAAVVLGEVTPAALACDGEEYLNKCWRHAAGFMCSPPLRKGQRDDLLKGLMEESEGPVPGLDLVASDHATFNARQKSIGLEDFTKVPLGVNGVEARMSVLWEKAVHCQLITPQRFVALTSSNPAKIFNIYPDKGRIAVGSHADIVIWDPEATRKISKENHNLKVDFNIFEGMECHGVPETVIARGRVMVDEGRLKAMQGFGRFVPLSTFSPFIYDKINKKQDKLVALESVKPVIRSAADMAIVVSNGNGSSGDGHGSSGGGDEGMPTPAPKRSTQPERAPSQQESHFDLKDHPVVDEQFEPKPSPQRPSVRVKAPPGGRSSGFW